MWFGAAPAVTNFPDFTIIYNIEYGDPANGSSAGR
jgi:hypothetical protein